LKAIILTDFMVTFVAKYNVLKKETKTIAIELCRLVPKLELLHLSHFSIL